MVTDFWASEELYIDAGQVIGFCTASSSLSAGQNVKFGTTAANQIVVTASTAVGDAIGTALKAVNTNDAVPVLFYGLAKYLASAAIAVGDMVKSATTVNMVVPLETLSFATMQILRGLNFTGTLLRMGVAMQGGGALDEILVLVGRLF